MTELSDVTVEQRARFLEVPSEHANLGEAVAGLPWWRILALPSADTDFVADWEAAVEKARDRLELAVWHRALDRIEEPYFYGAEECGTLRRHTDGLLLVLLRAERPEKFSDKPAGRAAGQGMRQNKVSGQGGPAAQGRSGVLVVPGPDDPRDWVREAKKHHRRLSRGGSG